MFTVHDTIHEKTNILPRGVTVNHINYLKLIEITTFGTMNIEITGKLIFLFSREKFKNQ